MRILALTTMSIASPSRYLPSTVIPGKCCRSSLFSSYVRREVLCSSTSDSLAMNLFHSSRCASSWEMGNTFPETVALLPDSATATADRAEAINSLMWETSARLSLRATIQSLPSRIAATTMPMVTPSTIRNAVPSRRTSGCSPMCRSYLINFDTNEPASIPTTQRPRLGSHAHWGHYLPPQVPCHGSHCFGQPFSWNGGQRSNLMGSRRSSFLPVGLLFLEPVSLESKRPAVLVNYALRVR